MADVYLEQARYFANVPLMQSGVVASVHLENGDDKLFWNTVGATKPKAWALLLHHTKP